MARSFNGSSDHVDAANASNFSFEFTQAFSASAWVKLTSNVGGTIMGKHDGITDGGWELRHFPGTTTPKLDLWLDGASVGAAVRTTTEWALATWLHVLITSDGTGTTAGMLIYVNGSSQATTASIAGPVSGTIVNTAPFRVGCRGVAASPANFSNAAIARPALWKATLSSGDATNLATGRWSPQQVGSNLVSFWKFDGASPEPDGQAANDGTVTGTSFVANPAALNISLPDARATTPRRNVLLRR